LEPSPAIRIPGLTLALVAALVGVHLWVRASQPLDGDVLLRMGGKSAALVLDLGQTWRLLTANFLHKGTTHLLLNAGALLLAGGALENAYRRVAVGVLLFTSGVGALAASVWWTDAVSVGASGILFGCLGAVLVLFVKHRAHLPVWHRRVLSEAGLPLSIVFLVVGFVAPGGDRAAHAGGLLVGLGLTPWLRPRLLGGERRRAREALALAGMAAVALSLGLGESLFAGVLPPLRLERDDGFGIQLSLPWEWRHTANRLGKLAFSNGLPGHGRATLSAEVVYSGEPLDAQAQARRFTAESLTAGALGLPGSLVSLGPPEVLRLNGREAVRVRAQAADPPGETELSAYFLPRGDLVYQLVFTWPRAMPGYAALVERLSRGIVLDEPKALREARGRALLFPSAPGTLGELGEVLCNLGESASAVEVLRTAVREAPSNVAFREGLARALLQAGQIAEGCRAAEEAAALGPERLGAYMIQARCALARNEPRVALRLIEEAALRAPSDERLRSAVRELRAALEEPGH